MPIQPGEVSVGRRAEDVMACPCERACSLFEQRAIQASARVWRSYYCDCAFERCERYRLGVSGRPVPDALLPNGRTLELPLAFAAAQHA